MVPTGQRPFLKDSWHHNSILWEDQLAEQQLPIKVFRSAPDARSTQKLVEIHNILERTATIEYIKE